MTLRNKGESQQGLKGATNKKAEQQQQLRVTKTVTKTVQTAAEPPCSLATGRENTRNHNWSLWF